MTPMTTAMPRTVAKPEINISQRTLATIFACAGSSGASSSRFGLADGLVMAKDRAHIESVVVAAENAGERLDRVLAAGIETLSRSRLKALIMAGQVAVGGRTIRDPSERVNAGAEITVKVPQPEPATPQGEAFP